MSTYKITNVTNALGKREFKHNSVLDVDYIDSMVKKVIKIKPGDSVFLTINKLPMSLHKLRVKGLVTVVEIGASEFAGLTKNATPKPKIEKKIESKESQSKPEESSKPIIKKKTIKKEGDFDD